MPQCDVGSRGSFVEFAIEKRGSNWPKWRPGHLENRLRWGPARAADRGEPKSSPESQLKAKAWLERARLEVSREVPTSMDPAAACQSYKLLQSLLRHVAACGEAETQLWERELGLKPMCDLEALLREKARKVFSIAKFALARDRSQFRADLLRPTMQEMSCDEVWQQYCKLRGRDADAETPRFPTRKQALLPERLLSQLTGCTALDASTLIGFAQQLSELFAPMELANRVGRQDWQNRPFALGVALLLPLETAVLQLQVARHGRLKVAVLGGCLLVAATAARLGCDVWVVEQRELSRRALQQLADENGLDSIVIGEHAPADVDIVVWEGIDEDTLLEGGHLLLLKRLLKKRRCQSATPPIIIPARIRVYAAAIDDGIGRRRGFDLSRFDRLRANELAFPHRWPRGACHQAPVMRSAAATAFTVDLLDFCSAEETHLESVELTLALEPFSPVTGIGFWITSPDGSLLESTATSAPEPEKAWLAFVQPLPPRRSGARVTPATIRGSLTDSRIWFQWSAEELSKSTVPGTEAIHLPISKTRLPAWHFKMLNDHERNRRYGLALDRALARASARNSSVVDCGCGAGLLSLLAARAGAKTVCSIEISAAIADVADETISGYLRERGPDLTLPSMRLFPQEVRSIDPAELGRHDVIVCELMDASGLGESLLGVLLHACRHLAAPSAQVIPCRLVLRGCLGFVGLPSRHGCLDFAPLDLFWSSSRRGGPFAAGAPPPLLFAGASPAPTETPSLLSGPFSSKNLNRLRRGDSWDYLSADSSQLLAVNISQALLGKETHVCETETEIIITRSGIVNCIHWWWTASLDDEEELSNRPLAAGGTMTTHWHQPFAPIGPLPVRAGDRFRLKATLNDAHGQKLAFTLSPWEEGSASAWEVPGQLLKKEPLEDIVGQWKQRMEEACAASSALTEKFTSRGDVAGLACIQLAVLAIVAYPRLFFCDAHVRDRLLQTFFGVAYK